MAVLAFYKGKGDWLDRAIRFITRSPFSHVELVSPGHGWHDQKWPCISSSTRDSGVRIKYLDLYNGNWELVGCPWAPTRSSYEDARKHLGRKYDYVGLFLSQFFHFNRHNKRRFFCSEFVGTAIGLDKAHRLSPSDLFIRANELNRAYEGGRTA